MVLEVVRIAVNDQYPRLMSTLYPRVMTTDPRPFGTLNVMCLAFQSLVKNKTPAINGDFVFFPCFFVGRAFIRPFGAPAAGNGRGQCRTPSRSPASQTRSQNTPIVMNANKSIPDCTDPLPPTAGP